jgi:hypothetical protein
VTAVAPDVARHDLDLERAEGASPVEGLTAHRPDPDPAPARGWLRRFWFVPAGVALLGAAALVPSVGGSGPGAGEARVLVDGVAVVTAADGATTTVRDDRVDVGPGDQVAVREGRATFEMAGDVRLEGRGRHDGRDGTTVEMAVAPRLVTGALLAVAPSPLEIEAGGATVSIGPSGATEGAVRLDRRLGLGVGTYRGRVAVETAGRRAEVPRYRRIEVAAPGALGPSGLPLRYEADDSWDRRFLGDALVIDTQIAPLLASLGPAERDSFLDAATLRRAMPGLPSGGGLADRLADVDDGGDALVLAAIAGAVPERSFATAWDQAVAFQADGAPWGLAAIDQGARSSEVLPMLRAALDTVDLQAPTATDDDDDATGAEADADGADPTDPATDPAAAAGGAGAAGPGGEAPDPSDPTGPTTVPSGGGGSGTPGGPLPTVPGIPPPPSVPTPTTPNVPEVVEGVGGAVGGAVDGVTDGIDAVVPGAGEIVDGVVGGVGGLVGGVGDAVAGAGEAAGGAVGGIVGGLGGAVGGLGTGLGTALGGPGSG